MPRYAMLGAGVRLLRPEVPVLDAGAIGSYVGIDHSAEAISRALEQGLPNCRLEVADFRTWQSHEQYDIVFSNETAYYAERPLDLIMGYEQMQTHNATVGGDVSPSQHAFGPSRSRAAEK